MAAQAADRLKKRAEFLAARKGRRLNGPLFFIEALDRRDGGPARYGLTVTRKVGNSVERNRIRRRLREAIRVVSGADMVPGFDYVIVARRDLLSTPFDRIGAELSARFRKVAPGGGISGRGEAASTPGGATRQDRAEGPIERFADPLDGGGVRTGDRARPSGT